MTLQETVAHYAEDLTEAANSRQFAQLVGKWFAPDCMLTFRADVTGVDDTLAFWKGHIHIDRENPLRTEQSVFKIEGRRVYSYRAVSGAQIPAGQILWGYQETEIDDDGRITDVIIRSVAQEPDEPVDESLKETELGKTFMAFHDAFADYLSGGDPDELRRHLAPDVHVAIDSSFWNKGIIGPHNRIHPGVTFALESAQPTGENTALAQIRVVRPQGTELAPWEVSVTPEGKIKSLVISGDV